MDQKRKQRLLITFIFEVNIYIHDKYIYYLVLKKKRMELYVILHKLFINHNIIIFKFKSFIQY